MHLDTYTRPKVQLFIISDITRKKAPCWDIKKVFMLYDLFYLKMVEAFQQQQSETHTKYLEVINLRAITAKPTSGNICWNRLYWQTYGRERHLMQNIARCQVHFCGFPDSVCACVCVHACWHTCSWIFRRLGMKSFYLLYVWSFCKHVSVGKDSTCMHDTQHTHINSIHAYGLWTQVIGLYENMAVCVCVCCCFTLMQQICSLHLSVTTQLETLRWKLFCLKEAELLAGGHQSKFDYRNCTPVRTLKRKKIFKAREMTLLHSEKYILS